MKRLELIRLILLVLSSLFLGAYAQKTHFATSSAKATDVKKASRAKKATDDRKEIEFKKPKVIDGEIV